MGTICSETTPVVWPPSAAERVCEGHHDLFQRGVAGPLAEAVDGHLDLARPGGDGRQRVGDGEAQVVVAVDADDRVATDAGPRRA